MAGRKTLSALLKNRLRTGPTSLTCLFAQKTILMRQDSLNLVFYSLSFSPGWLYLKNFEGRLAAFLIVNACCGFESDLTIEWSPHLEAMTAVE